MRKISLFAYNNPVFARILITGIHILLFRIALFFSDQWSFSFIAIGVCCLTLFALRELRVRFRLNFISKKAIFFLAGCSFFVITCNIVSYSYKSETTVIQSAAMDLMPAKKQMSKKEMRTQLRAAVKELKKISTNADEKSGKTIKTILVVLLTLGLLLLLSALACSLACNGAGALAAILAIGGSVGIIFLMVTLLKKINKKEPAVETKKEG